MVDVVDEANATVDVPNPVGPTGIKLRFADVKRLISSISDDMIGIETLLEVGRRFPCGPDRISAYRMALARAERSESKDTKDAVSSNTYISLQTVFMSRTII